MTYQTLKDEANKFFTHSANEMVAERKSLQMFVTGLLMKSSRRKEYKGFGYLTQDQVPAGKTFGVTYTTHFEELGWCPKDGGFKVKSKTVPNFHDESRIFFY
jgi:hypothetical protein